VVVGSSGGVFHENGSIDMIARGLVNLGDMGDNQTTDIGSIEG
jgi:hypothetical protein